MLLVGLELGDEFLNVSGTEIKFSGCRYDGYFVLDVIHEW